MQDVDYIRIDDPLELGIKMDDTNPESMNAMVEFANTTADRHADEILNIASMLLDNKAKAQTE